MINKGIGVLKSMTSHLHIIVFMVIVYDENEMVQIGK